MDRCDSCGAVCNHVRENCCIKLKYMYTDGTVIEEVFSCINCYYQVGPRP